MAGGELAVELRVYFVDTGQTMLAKRYTGKPDNPRIFAHQASDDIMTLTQNRGVARTKIAFVSDRDGPSPRGRPAKELYIMDYDSYNPRRVTVNSSINILPAWSPDGRSLAYSDDRRGQRVRAVGTRMSPPPLPRAGGGPGKPQQGPRGPRLLGGRGAPRGERPGPTGHGRSA